MNTTVKFFGAFVIGIVIVWLLVYLKDDIVWWLNVPVGQMAVWQLWIGLFFTQLIFTLIGIIVSWVKD